MRIGVVLTVTLNIPFTQIESAELKRHADGSGDISIKLVNGNKIAYPHLWPHCRGWFFSDPRPRITGLKNVEAVAAHFTTLWGSVTRGDAKNLPEMQSSNNFENRKEVAI